MSSQFPEIRRESIRQASISTINFNTSTDYQGTSTPTGELGCEPRDNFGGAGASFVKKISFNQDKRMLRRSSTSLSGFEVKTGIEQDKDRYVGQISNGSDVDFMGKSDIDDPYLYGFVNGVPQDSKKSLKDQQPIIIHNKDTTSDIVSSSSASAFSREYRDHS